MDGVDVAYLSADGDAGHVHEWVNILSETFRPEITRMFSRSNAKSRWSHAFLFAAWLVLIFVVSARAHNGPPYPIIENQRVGPCIVALWTHPDVGTGAFYVFVEPTPGGAVPDDLKIEIGVQPITGRLPEVLYPAERVKSRGQVQFNAQAEFDRQELWRVRLVMQSSQGSGEATAQVEVTPPGFGRWDLLLYLLPFLAVAFLWFLGVSRAKRRRNSQVRGGAAAAAQTASPERVS
jgi:hypothetical protein